MKHSLRYSSRHQGFTLIELLVTVVIVAILASLAAPGLKNFSRNQMIYSVMTALSNDLKYARSEAVSRKTPIQICPSADGTTCSNNSSWVDGWIILIPKTSECPAASECRLRIQSSVNPALTLNASVSTGVIFDEEGATSNSVIFALCDKDRPAKSDSYFLRTLFLKTSGSSAVRHGASTCNP